MNTSSKRARWWALAPTALVLALAGCGRGSGATSPPASTGPDKPPESTAAPPPTTDADPVPARLRISHRQTSCCYIEGQISYVLVRDSDGTLVAQRHFMTSKPGRPVLDVPLLPGRYVVTSYHRPCDGNCGYLDPPTDRCTKRITVAAGDDVELMIKFAPAHGCEFV